MKQNMESNKLKPTFLYEEAGRRYQELKECAEKIESEIQKAPSGIIHIVNSGKRVQFYLREDKSDKDGKYIRKADAQTIRVFLRKSYYEKVIKLMKAEINNLGNFLKNQII